MRRALATGVDPNHRTLTFASMRAGLYAPQDAEELAGAGEALATGVDLALDELPDAGPSQKLVAAAARQVAEAHRGLQAALRELARSAADASGTRPEE